MQRNEALIKNISIVLVGTLQSGNIGSAARAMHNMGILELRLAHPHCAIDDQSYWMATHAADILKQSRCFATLHDALSDSAYVFGTTARSRRFRSFITPQEMAVKILPLAIRNKVSVVFGPEDRGLSNEELELCNEVVSIHTASDASSMNIAHAVLIACYEIFKAACADNTRDAAETLASSRELEQMYGHMHKVLMGIGYFEGQNPKIVIGKFKRILTRAGLTGKDVKLIRGVFRQLLWFVKKSV